MTDKLKRLVDFYMIMILLGIVLWIPFPEIGSVIGATSVIHAFLIAVGDAHEWMRYLALIWILVFAVFVTVAYFLVCTKRRYTPFIVIVGMELLIAGAFVVYKICCGNDYKWIMILVGYIIRFLYCTLIFHIYTSIHIRKDDSQEMKPL